MNGNQSRYEATAELMDEALLELLENKDLEYITVKEICSRAGVSRSTFYLHYETMDDLLTECVKLMVDRLIEGYGPDSPTMVSQIRELPLGDLYFIADEFLIPYLKYIKTNARLFRAALANPRTLHLDKTYSSLWDHVLSPVLDRFGVPLKERRYLMTFYLNGIMAVVEEWLRGGCIESEEFVAHVVRKAIGAAEHREV